MISARSLTKRYGPKTVVDDLSFDVKPGVVTGFLGPNGAGESTTMRMIMGVDTADGGTATLSQPTAAIMIALIWTLVAEPIIGGLLPAVGRRLPLSSASNMTAIEPHHDSSHR